MGWIINQVFAFLGLIFVIISFQQKSAKKLIILRSIATLFVLIGLIFLGNTSAIIMCGAGVIRNLVSLYFAFKPKSPKTIKVVSSILIIILLIILNIIFWNNLLNIYSILLGSLNVCAFMQEKASTIRKYSVVAEVFAIIYYSILLTPINIIIEIIGLASAIIGIVRIDLKKSAK